MNSERRQLIDLLHINENALQMARDVSDVVFLLRQNAATCRAMWLAVIEQALRDLHSPSRELRQSARLWLTGKSIGLRIVCDLAGINVDALQRGLRQHSRSGMPSARMGCVRRRRTTK